MTKKSQNAWFWLAVIAVFFLFIFSIRSILLPFVLGMGAAYFLDPAADRLQRMKFSRGYATLFITACFFSMIVLLLLFITPVIAGQLSAMLGAIPNYVAQIDREFIPYMERKMYGVSPQLMAEVKSSITSSSGLIGQGVTNFVGRVLTSGFAFINIMSLILITPIVTFYLLRDWDNIVAHIDALLPKSHAQTIREQCIIINRTLAGFVHGQLNVCMLLGLYYAILLSVIGLNFGFIIGLATGFLVIFPYVGLLVGALTGIIVAFFQFADMTPVLMVLAVFVSGQVIESNFVTPKLVGDKVGLHPAWIIFAMLAGGALFGFVGVLLAVPMAAVMGVLVRFAIARYLQSSYSK